MLLFGLEQQEHQHVRCQYNQNVPSHARGEEGAVPHIDQAQCVTFTSCINYLEVHMLNADDSTPSMPQCVLLNLFISISPACTSVQISCNLLASSTFLGKVCRCVLLPSLVKQKLQECLHDKLNSCQGSCVPYCGQAQCLPRT